MDTELKINPKLLQWAREESGYSESEMANRIHVDPAKYLDWEKTGLGLSLNELVTLSKICKRQIAFFFLISVPPKTKKPTDFRNLEPALARLSEKTLLAIRRTARFQDFLLQLHGSEYYRQKYSWLTDFRASFASQLDSEGSINRIRSLLEYPIEEQMAAGIDAETSYKRWRNSVEHKLGIHVFQFAMPASEAQGFSYSDSFPYCVTVNNAYPATSRTFTLFHELSHILKSQSGLCKPDDTIFRKEETSTEYECNSFAGSLLVPAKEVVPAKDKDFIFKYATKFKISSEVYLRRLYALGQVSENEFFPLLDEIRRAVLPTRPHYSKSPVNKSINSRGLALFNSTLDAMSQRKVTYSLASDILGLKVNYLSGLQR
jgi:Zn-dependent peptidase ImmA (M78 family)/transcriptional regulator with XRE-family HTH domain